VAGTVGSGCREAGGMHVVPLAEVPTVENLLPNFDFDYTIRRRLASTGGTRTVVLMVVDSADFDCSFPQKVAKLVSTTIEENHKA
jgi:hypothetical protein